MKKDKYDATTIQVLSGIEAVRKRPAMYIGDTSIGGLHHLVYEVVDNSIDEAMAGFCSRIKVVVHSDNSVTVEDNGRGIPISQDTPKVISTKLFSGAKFQHTKSAYEISSGLHGVGLVAVNALSSEYIVDIYRNGRHGYFFFENSRLKEKSISPFNGHKPFSTKIEFVPDKSIFESLVPNIDRLRQRLFVASVELPECTFVLLVDGNKEIIKLNIDEFFNTHCLNKTDNLLIDLVKGNVMSGPEKFAVFFSYSDNGPPKVVSSINLLPVTSGGTHVNVFFDILREFFGSKAKKLNYKFL